MVSLIGRRIPTTGVEGAQVGGLGDVFGKFAAILADPLTPAIKREKLSEMNRQNIGTESLATRFGGGNVDPAQAAADAVRAGIDPSHLAGYDVYSTTKRYGPESPQAFTSAMARPGANYGTTIQGTREDFANRMDMQRAQEATKLKVAGQTPEYVMGPNGPVIAPRAESYGQRPVLPLGQEQGAAAARAQGQPGGIPALSPADQAFISAQPRAPEPYNIGMPGGGSQAVTFGANNELAPIMYKGQPVSSIGKIDATSEAFGQGDPLAKDLFNARRFTLQASAAIDRLGTALAQPDAGAAVGGIGAGARLLNDVLAQGRALSQLLGGNAQELDLPEIRNGVDRTMAALPLGMVQQAQQLGIDATVLRSQITNLGYLIAKAQNPSGPVTEPDFRRAADTIGASLQDPTAMTRVLADVKSTLQANLQIHETLFAQTRGAGAPGASVATPPAQAATQSAPTANPDTVMQNGHTYQRQPDGSYR